MPTGYASQLFREAFETELLQTIDDTDTGPDQWSVAGKNKTKSNPNGEDAAWWRANGPDMVNRWVAWRQRAGWRLWVTPDGEPAIELNIETNIPTLGEPIPLKMFVDRVFITNPTTNQLCIVDLKAGARSPESDLQLGVYRYGIWRRYGVDIRLGAYWLARKDVMEPVDLSRYTPDLMEMWFRRFRQATNSGVFLPNVTFKCRACPVRDYCVAFGGSRSELDPDHPANTRGKRSE